jgi:hypothetical protein
MEVTREYIFLSCWNRAAVVKKQQEKKGVESTGMDGTRMSRLLLLLPPLLLGVFFFVGRCHHGALWPFVDACSWWGWRGSKLKTAQKTCLAVHFFFGTPDTKITASASKGVPVFINSIPAPASSRF